MRSSQATSRLVCACATSFTRTRCPIAYAPEAAELSAINFGRSRAAAFTSKLNVSGISGTGGVCCAETADAKMRPTTAKIKTAQRTRSAVMLNCALAKVYSLNRIIPLLRTRDGDNVRGVRGDVACFTETEVGIIANRLALTWIAGSAACRERRNRTPVATNPSQSLQPDCPPAESYSGSRACTEWQYAGPATSSQPKPGRRFCSRTRAIPVRIAWSPPALDRKPCNGRNTIWKTCRLGLACLWIPMNVH